MARNVVVTCDIGQEEGARTYTISYDSTSYQVDLCEAHAEPILAIAKHGTASPSMAQAGPSGTGMKHLDRRIRGVPAPENGE